MATVQEMLAVAIIALRAMAEGHGGEPGSEQMSREALIAMGLEV